MKPGPATLRLSRNIAEAHNRYRAQFAPFDTSADHMDHVVEGEVCVFVRMQIRPALISPK